MLSEKQIEKIISDAKKQSIEPLRQDIESGLITPEIMATMLLESIFPEEEMENHVRFVDEMQDILVVKKGETLRLSKEEILGKIATAFAKYLNHSYSKQYEKTYQKVKHARDEFYKNR